MEGRRERKGERKGRRRDRKRWFHVLMDGTFLKMWYVTGTEDPMVNMHNISSPLL